MRRRRKKPGTARIVDELSKKLQEEYEPLGVMCLLIMGPGVRFFEKLPNQILTSGENDHVEKEMSVLLALFSFYAHLMMLFAAQRLTVVQLEYLQKHVTTVASEGVINYYHAGCTEETKQNLTNALTKDLNEGINEYAYAIGNTHGISKKELETKLPDLLSRAGSEVAKACGGPSDVAAITVIKEHLFINYMVIAEAVKVDELLLEIRAALPSVAARCIDSSTCW